MIYYSFISYRFNSFPEDCISVGMIFIDDETNEFKIKVSEIKMKIAKKIKISASPYVFKMFNNSIRNLCKADSLTLDKLDYLHRHQNGIIKIDKPSSSSCKMEDFDIMFEKRLEENFKKKEVN